MRVVVVGATGKTGQHALRALLGRGHEVTAFGRSIDRIDIDDPRLKTYRGDVFDTDSVEAALAGQDAVIICLGSTGLRDKTTLSVGTKVVVDAMLASGVGRLVVISAAGVGESRKQIPWSSRFLFSTLLRNVFADHRGQEAIVEHSTLDWTIIRPGVLRDDPGTGNYTATNTGPIAKISRADVAVALVDQLADSANSRRAISVTSSRR